MDKSRIGFVSSNFWDIAGAAFFGFSTFWVNRDNAQPDDLGILPTATVSKLTGLVHCVGK